MLKRWLKGYVIFTLTLEERATCLRSVTTGITVGNNMAFAHRIEHGQH